tara:strand:- start:4117 stop:4470 length:354 start_codon:yes stop_codon:yes gene_type:complete
VIIIVSKRNSLLRWNIYKVLKIEDGLTGYQIYDKLKEANFNSSSLCLQKIIQSIRNKAFYSKMEGKTRKYYINHELAEEYFKESGFYDLIEAKRHNGRRCGVSNTGKKIWKAGKNAR